MDWRYERDFTLPPQVLFDAFTRPRSMQSWWQENTRFGVNLRQGGDWSIGWPHLNSYTYVGGFFDKVEPPYKLSYHYRFKTIESYLNPEKVPVRDSIFIEIEAIDGGSSLKFIDRISNGPRDQSTRKLGDSFREGVSWTEVFDLIEENMQDDRFRAIKVDIPSDLEVILYDRFRAIFYGSSSGQIFASIFYEEGSFQGDVIFELSDEEKKQFNADSKSFIEEYSTRVGDSFFDLKDRRHIYEFNYKVNVARLTDKWRKENE